MTYAETLQRIEAHYPMYQKVGASAFKGGLDNIRAMMDATDHPEQQFKSIHLAGTNGKGSTAHILSSILMEAGYTTGLFTTPHIKDFRERVKINGQLIPEEQVADFVTRTIDPFQPIVPSFFEWSVALAYDHFAREQVDIAIIECGMGGLDDATNVITPEVSIITNVGHDHQDFLGPTLKDIAEKKAGIIKPGVPVIFGQRHPETETVFKEVAQRNQSLYHFADDAQESDLPTDLKGEYQRINLRTAHSALNVLRSQGWGISEDAERKGASSVVANTSLRGRWEILGTDPLIVADIAHNREGVEAVLQQINATPYRFLIVIINMVRGKELTEVLSMLPQGVTVFWAPLENDRGLSKQEFDVVFDQVKPLAVVIFPSIAEALEGAKFTLGPEDLILITGSTFVVAEVL